MPKTLTSSEAANNSRYNPYITKSISKSLLTPCRQVGLSRKRKTPNSSEKNLDIISSSSQELEKISETKTTLITSKKRLSENSSNHTKIETKANKADLTKKSVSKCLIAADTSNHKSLEVTVLSDHNSESSDFSKQLESKEVPPKEKRNEDNFSKKTNCVVKESKKVKDKKKKEQTTAEKLEDNKVSETKTTLINSKKAQGENFMEHIEIESKVNKADVKKQSVFKCLTVSDKSNQKSLEATVVSNHNSESSDFSKQSESNVVPPKERRKEDNPSKKTNSVVKEFKKVKDKKKEEKLLTTTEKVEDNKNSPLKEINIENDKVIKNFVVKETELHSPKQAISEQISPKLKSPKQENTQSMKSKSPKTINPMLDHDYVRPEKKSTKLKRSLSMKKSSEDYQNQNLSKDAILKECSILLSHIDNDTLVNEILPNISQHDISKLENEVKEKRKLIEDLTQAEIYKKLHDVNKLKELTATWKTGCISALNDLLPHLQTRGRIDMAMVLNTLGVPEKLIKLSENGDLI